MAPTNIRKRRHLRTRLHKVRMETGTTTQWKKANTPTSTCKNVGAVMARLVNICIWDNVSFVMYESDHKQRVMAVLEARKAPRGDCDADRVRIATRDADLQRIQFEFAEFAANSFAERIRCEFGLKFLVLRLRGKFALRICRRRQNDHACAVFSSMKN